MPSNSSGERSIVRYVPSTGTLQAAPSSPTAVCGGLTTGWTWTMRRLAVSLCSPGICRWTTFPKMAPESGRETRGREKSETDARALALACPAKELPVAKLFAACALQPRMCTNRPRVWKGSPTPPTWCPSSSLRPSSRARWVTCWFSSFPSCPYLVTAHRPR